MPVVEVTLDIENVVTPTTELRPLTGVWESSNSIAGWKWDKRLLAADDVIQSRYDTYLGGHDYGLTDGTVFNDWVSGSIGDLKYLDLVDYKLGDYRTWTPRVETDNYSLLFDDRPLFSDYSVAGIFSVDSLEDGLMTYVLRTDAVYETLNIALYKRDSSLRIFEHYKFDSVDEFTGIIVSDARISTVDGGGNIIPANIETRKYEYIVTTDKVTLNNNYSLVIGSQDSVEYPSDHTDPTNTVLEYKQAGKTTGRKVFTNYFPLARTSVKLISLSNADVITEWIEQDNLNFSQPTDLHFSVDYDLGILITGGFQAPDLVLSAAITDTDTEIPVYLDEEVFAQYPAQGIIVIGSEQIAYYGKGYKSFTDCIRGHNLTTPAAASIGAVVADIQHGAGTSDFLYVAYTAVPRIEYEVLSYNVRSANASPWLDVHPLTNIDTNNIVEILSADISLDSIELRSNSLQLTENSVYGPIYYGSDVSQIIAKALDLRGNPVDDIRLTINILGGGGGNLNGGTSSYTDISNTLGEIYALYNSPHDRSSMEKTAVSVTQVGLDTHMAFTEIDSDVSVDDVWVFQVLKHDKMTGTPGLKLSITGNGAASSPLGVSYINVNGLIDESYRGGIIRILSPALVVYNRTISNVFTFESAGIPYSRIYLKEYIDPAFIDQDCWLLESEAVTWNSTLLNGSRHIIYEWSASAIHPTTGLSGAYMPVRPDSISGNTLVFANRTLPVPDPTDDSNNLGGYVAIMPDIVKLQASGQDPITGRTISSNIIRLALQLPQFLIGVDSTGPSPIPYGWKLVTQSFNIGAGIGGANFITINKDASNINQFSITGAIP